MGDTKGADTGGYLRTCWARPMAASSDVVVVGRIGETSPVITAPGHARRSPAGRAIDRFTHASSSIDRSTLAAASSPTTVRGFVCSDFRRHTATATPPFQTCRHSVRTCKIPTLLITMGSRRRPHGAWARTSKQTLGVCASKHLPLWFAGFYLQFVVVAGFSSICLSDELFRVSGLSCFVLQGLSEGWNASD
jgi:hypothetical protein